MQYVRGTIADILPQIPEKDRSTIKEYISSLNTSDVITIFIDENSYTIMEKAQLAFIDYELPHLVKDDKDGVEHIWKIWVQGNVVHKSYGHTTGKHIHNERAYDSVNKKNKNITTPEEQAKREAERDWVKQLDKGYTPRKTDKKGMEMMAKVNTEKQKQGNANMGISTVIRSGAKKPVAKKKKDKLHNLTVPGYTSAFHPMHAEKWNEENKCLKYFDFEKGVAVQPKLDGIRAHLSLQKIVDPATAEILGIQVGSLYCILTSRKGKQFVWLKHIRDQGLIFLKDHPDIILDGELYCHHMVNKDGEELEDADRFDQISGACRVARSDPHELESQISLHIFDIADPTGKLTQVERFDLLDKLFNRADVVKKCPSFVRVMTQIINNKEAIKDIHDNYYYYNGYEGVILRSKDLMYQSDVHSLMMRKHKYFQDEEYKVVGVKVDPGLPEQNFVWICEAEVEGEKKTFRAKPMGSEKLRKKRYDERAKYINKAILTVRFQELTKTGVPKFPRGIAIRDYE
jgi:ATP-dependent DNA ligase